MRSLTKPELVAALQRILNWSESRDGSPEADERALRAIATEARDALEPKS
jgi:hypothetical protein